MEMRFSNRLPGTIRARIYTTKQSKKRLTQGPHFKQSIHIIGSLPQSLQNLLQSSCVYLYTAILLKWTI